MLKYLLALLFAGCALHGAVAPDATYVRLSGMPKPPVIDGRIDYDEWRYASTSFGGVSNKSGLLTKRENDFRFGYDAKNFYFAVTSEMPVPPQTMTRDDKVEFRIVPPNGKETIIIIDCEGKGTIPGGVTFKSTFAPALMNRFRNNCWTIEAAVPLTALGVSAIENGKEWKLQMMRHWSSAKETGFWHYTPKGKGNEYGIFVPDASAPVVSFDGFGHHGYEASGNYQWTYRMENNGAVPVEFYSDCYTVGIAGESTLDIKNPELLAKETKMRIGFTEKEGFAKLVKPGQRGYFLLYQMAQFPGKPRLLASKISNRKSHELYYQRTFFWDVSLAFKAAHYEEKLGLPYLSTAYYPSFGSKLRVAASFNEKLPIYFVRIELKDANGKVLWKFSRSGFGRKLEDFEEETVLKELPLGDYKVEMTSTDGSGRKYLHTRTFSNRKFAWQNQNIGRERVIIPPFKPLVLDREKQIVKALLTGYKQGGGLWSEIYAEGENILAAPVAFYFEGKPVIPGKAKLVSEEKDRIVYESIAKAGKVDFTFTYDYDYDGFCKVTVKAVPQGKVAVRDFGFNIPLKSRYLKYYNSLVKTGQRGGNAPDLTLPGNQGEVKMTGISLPKDGRVVNYLWLGGARKGFCWMIDSTINCSLDRGRAAWKLTRAGEVVNFRQEFVNQFTQWTKPLEWVIGFEPTPIKPRNEKYLAIAGWMFDYPVPQGADHADMISEGCMAPWLDYPIDTLAKHDPSFHAWLFSTRNKATPREEERIAFAKKYIERNRAWMEKELPLLDFDHLYRQMLNKRLYGKKYYLHYQLPTLYSHHWPEAEMYKAEWLPWDYPVDDAADEYLCNQTSVHSDFLLYIMRDQARRGYDGMNFDCFPLGGAFNTVVGAGARFAPGRVPYLCNENMWRNVCDGVHAGRLLFGWRELMKRTATMLYTEGKLPYGTPWVDLHATDCQACPVAAFCSTVITWERSGDGTEFQNRFPESFFLADTAGMQAGCIPQTIVKTNSNKIPKPEQMKSLIAYTLAYGTLCHCDQGIQREHADYKKSRDIPFTFGFGRPENQTIFWYSDAKQPITCAAPEVRTTQVIRPDGKALLMIGNMSDHPVTARFDLAGLNYGSCRITDQFSGLMLAEPVVKLEKYGYAMLLIEKGAAPSAEEIEKHNQRITGVTTRFDKAESMTYENPETPVDCKDGAFTLGGMVHFWSRDLIPLEMGRSYTIAGELRKKAGEDHSSVTIGAIFYDASGRRLSTGEYMTIPGSLTVLASPVKPGDTTAVVKAVPGFRYDSGSAVTLVFNAKADESDLPNRAIAPGIIKSLKRDGDKIIVSFTRPLETAFAAGTGVRLHFKYNFYCPVPAGRWYNRPQSEWQSVGGRVTVPRGASAMRIAVICHDARRPVTRTFEMRNLRLITK